MPANVTFLTQEEYDGIMQRLAALEAAIPARSSDIVAINVRIQSLESTIASFAKTIADWPARKITAVPGDLTP